MGFSLSWLAVRGKPASDILHELQLRPTGEHALEGESPFVGGQSDAGWYLLVMPGAEHHLLQPEALERLSAACEVVTCTVEEHVMFSQATRWHHGRQVWAVTHEGEAGPVGVEEQGTLPPEYPLIRDPLMREQGAAGGAEADVDHLFDIPVKLAQALVGYRHDERSPAFEGGGFEVLESEARSRTWLGRLLGKNA